MALVGRLANFKKVLRHFNITMCLFSLSNKNEIASKMEKSALGNGKQNEAVN